MIINLEGEEESSSENSEDEGGNIEDMKKRLQKNNMSALIIGKGHFGKIF